MRDVKKVVFIKCGGSFITDKETPYTENTQNIQLFAKQFREVYERFPDYQFVIGNGAGSFGHYAVLEHGVKDGIANKNEGIGFAKVHDAASRLNGLFIQHLLQHNLPVFSVQPSAFLTTSDGSVTEGSIQIITHLLDLGMIPSVYGDIVVDREKGCHILSTESIFEVLINHFLSQSYKIKQIIHLTTVPGVHDKNGEVIKDITTRNKEEVLSSLSQTKGFDVTGGMRHKIEESLGHAESGIPSYTGTINSSESLKNVILEKNKTGTTIC
jgi:isopentenyl phosphate kinase